MSQSQVEEEEQSDEEMLQNLTQNLNSYPNNPNHHFNMALYLWDKGEDGKKEMRDKSLEHLVTCVKLDTSNSAAFRLMGRYYTHVSVDLQRATKCLQRAVVINPDDSEAGEALCELLDKVGKESLEVSVCREASGKSPRAFWAWRRLGYLQVFKRQWTDAVQSLQHAIRGYPTCADLWEALGLAYQRLGMFTAALKSYGRAIELDDSRVFSLIESGNILLMLATYTEAVERFRSALVLDPHNLAAQYGLGSSLLGKANHCAKNGAFGWGASLLEEACRIATEGSRLKGNMPSFWKLLGDIQISYANSLPWTEGDGVGNDQSTFLSSVNSWRRKQFSSAVDAKYSYQKALHVAPWKACSYIDLAISLDLLCSLEENSLNTNARLLAEKVSLGGLMRDSGNNDYWVVLGCLACQKNLQQHALLRGLQLDASDAPAWAYIGKLYCEQGENSLCKQAFDRARSLEPSLALPWAGMSTSSYSGDISPSEAFENCLRAVQLSPLSEFQLGLAELAARTNQLHLPQVFAAILQAIQHRPDYPEAHNLYGLVCEARSDFVSAVNAYRRARYTTSLFPKTKGKLHMTDISINLARALCAAGHLLDAANECEVLESNGLLDVKGLLVYAIVLSKLGNHEKALSVSKRAASLASTVNTASGASDLGLICKLIYSMLGVEYASSFILKMKRSLLQCSRNVFLIAGVNALDTRGELDSFLSEIQGLVSVEEAPEVQLLISTKKKLSFGSSTKQGNFLSREFLKKVLHMYPHSTLIRNQLASLLLQSGYWQDTHCVSRCVDEGLVQTKTGCLNSSYENLGAAIVKCYNSCSSKSKFVFPACKDSEGCGVDIMYRLQKWYHQEPWNSKARYLLILAAYQKAREEKFLRHVCDMLRRLLFASLSDNLYYGKESHYLYTKFMLLLCASEVSLRSGDYKDSASKAILASELSIPKSALFFAWFQLCRVHAASGDIQSLKLSYESCLTLGSDYEIGWLLLKSLECRHQLQSGEASEIEINFKACLTKDQGGSDFWMSRSYLVEAESHLSEQNFLDAEAALAHACSSWEKDGCLFLVHGAICMELARKQSGSEYLSRAVSSLSKAHENSFYNLPIVSALLAQAEASLGAKAKWEHDLKQEWFSWPAETRPAELYFQMYLLARQSKQVASSEYSNSPQRWILSAVHANPSCLRYWKVLQKVKEQSSIS